MKEPTVRPPADGEYPSQLILNFKSWRKHIIIQHTDISSAMLIAYHGMRPEGPRDERHEELRRTSLVLLFVAVPSLEGANSHIEKRREEKGESIQIFFKNYLFIANLISFLSVGRES